MRIATIADIHLEGKSLPDCETQFKALFRECKARGVETLLMAGDLFHKPNVGDNSASTGAVASVAVHGFLPFVEAHIPIYMILGNHDFAGVGSADALHLFDGMPGVSILREPGVFFLKDCNVHCLPWSWGKTQHNTGSSIEDLEYICTREESGSEPDILLAHVEIIGSSMGSTICKEKRGSYQLSIGDIMAAKVLSRTNPQSYGTSDLFCHFALGHFHSRQDLTEGRGGYVGAFRQRNFGEEGNPAGFEIYDTETRETEWIALHAAPRYKTFVLNAGDPMPEISLDDNMKYRVQIHGYIEDRSEVKKLEAMGDMVTVENILPRPERTQRADVKPDIMEDPHELFRLWASNHIPPLSEEQILEHLKTYDEEFGDNKATRPINSAVAAAEQPGPETSQSAPVRAKKSEQIELPF